MADHADPPGAGNEQPLAVPAQSSQPEAPATSSELPEPQPPSPPPPELSSSPPDPPPPPPPSGPPRLNWQWRAPDGQNVAVVRGEVRLGKLRFEVNRPTLEKVSEPLIKRLRAFLQAHPRITRLRIEAHTDDIGSRSHNRELTRRRAHAVGRALVRLGTDCQRLETYGFGITSPLVCNTCRARPDLSRRIDLRIAAYDGVDLPPPAAPADYGVTDAADPCQPLPPWP